MTDPSEQKDRPSGPGPLAVRPVPGTFARERRQLVNIAYRLLGSLSEAEDAVQETYARWYAMSPQQRRAIERPAAWLTRVVGRVCLNVLGSARARRENYVGAWLPEPIPGPARWPGGPAAEAADPADRVTLDETVTMAFLVVLESMTPAERVVLVLHDVFRYPFPEVARIVGRTPAACRQLAVSARARVRASPVAGSRPEAGQAAVVREFRIAWEAMDVGALVGLLDPEVRATGDGGGLAPTLPHPVTGAGDLARGLLWLRERQPGLVLRERAVNGRPGLVAEQDGTVVTVYAFGFVGERITHLWAVRNPEKLRPWRAAPASGRDLPPRPGVSRRRGPWEIPGRQRRP
ncbi:RNA polymerase sigma factor SigJ [Streptomyces sp. NPDC001515]